MRLTVEALEFVCVGVAQLFPNNESEGNHTLQAGTTNSCNAFERCWSCRERVISTFMVYQPDGATSLPSWIQPAVRSLPCALKAPQVSGEVVDEDQIACHDRGCFDRGTEAVFPDDVSIAGDATE